MKKQKPASNKAAAANTDVEQPTQSNIWQDERFQTLFKDPRFRALPQTVRKVKIDKRFQSMFSDEKFKVKYTVDKYGRRIDKSNAEDLRKFYDIDSNASSDSEDEQAKERLEEEKALAGEAVSEDAGDLHVAENDDDEISKTLRERLSSSGVDYARGEGRLLTDSSSDDETSDEDENDLVANIDHVWGELDTHTEMTDDSTRRLAVCNMDWDRIRATDLMVLCSSFLPPGGSILSVKIYTSDYGKERLALEEAQGPAELVGLAKQNNKKQTINNSSDSEEEEDLVQAQDSEAEEGDEYHMEKLRQYQLNRLRYYYAVVECDSVETADKIYKECDGTEYESSATRVDLRFIPDDTTFDEDEPTDVCTQLPDANSYKPRQFTTTALQQIKVDLTWDETAVERKELSDKLASGKLSEVNDKDLRNLVAYSSEEDNTDDEEEQKQEASASSHKTKQNVDNSAVQNDVVDKESKKDVIKKYKALLAEINQKEQEQKKQKYEMEFTWEVNDAKQEKNDQEPSEEEAETATKDENKHLTPIEKVLKKRSEKNKKRKTERKRKALLAKGIDPDAQSANDSDESDDLPDGIDLNDPYFAEEFANNEFIKKPSKKKENKKNKREQLEEQENEQEKQAQELALLLEDDDDEKQHFSLEKIIKAEQETKSKRKRRKLLKKSKSAIAEQRQQVEDNFEVNVADERFKNIYTSHLYNIDPTDSHFKKTKGMQKLIQEKLKRRQNDDNKVKTSAESETSTEAKRPKKQIENNLLVKSIKRKLQQQQQLRQN